MSDATGSAPAPAPQPTPTPAPAPAAPPSWHSSLSDEDRGWVENRGLHNKSLDDAARELLKTARNAESKFGIPPDRVLKLPADMNDPSAMSEIYSRLGRPESAKDYGFEGDGEDALTDGFVNKLADTFYDAGLSSAQAKALFSTIDREVTAIYEAQQAAAEEARAADLANLQREWGDTFALNHALAKEAVKATGATQEEIDALETALGSSAAVVKFFNRIGQKRGSEAAFVTGEKGDQFGATTPEAARAKIAEHKADPEWVKQFNAAQQQADHGASSRIVKEYRKLVAIAAQGG